MSVLVITVIGVAPSISILLILEPVTVTLPTSVTSSSSSSSDTSATASTDSTSSTSWSATAEIEKVRVNKRKVEKLNKTLKIFIYIPFLKDNSQLALLKTSFQALY